MRFKDRIIRLLKIWSAFTLIFVLLGFSWIAIHEISHMTVCKLLGGEPEFVQINPHPLVNCNGIIENNKLLIPKFDYFILTIIPYILGLSSVILVRLYVKEKKIIHLVIIAIIIVDTTLNYVASPFYMTDFRTLAIVSPVYFIISGLISLGTYYLGVSLIKNDWQKIKNYFKNVVKEIRR